MQFRERHLFQLLRLYEKQSLPIDRIVSEYFRTHRSLGANDRRYIGEAVYGLIRWRALLDAGGAGNWQRRYELWRAGDLRALRENPSLSPAARCGFSEELYQIFTAKLGEEKAFALGLVSNEQAPTTVRVNTLKISREALLKRWAEWGASPCKLSDVGIVLPGRLPLMATPEYREGLFELQDEGSQLVAAQVAAKPGDLVLDFCAGAGGKSLPIAAKLLGRGQIYLHDVRKWILTKARLRLRRAGIQNAQFLVAGSPPLEALKQKMDWVLVDVPCSGSGTWRRHPDMKWQLSTEQLPEIVNTQKAIVAEALTYLAPRGRLVYATCSVLPDENERQVETVCAEFGLKVASPPFSSWPTTGEMDGFFAAVLEH